MRDFSLSLHPILDRRAATYEKLDQLQAALRDSRRMIEMKPEAAKVQSHIHRSISSTNPKLRAIFDAEGFCNSKGKGMPLSRYMREG